MEIEGIKALAELAKKSGLKGSISFVFLIAIILIIFSSVLKAGGILDHFKECEVVFKGTVFDKNGDRLSGVLVKIEGINDGYQLTDSQGYFAITILNSDLKSTWVTISFGKDNSVLVTRRVCWKEKYGAYFEVVIL